MGGCVRHARNLRASGGDAASVFSGNVARGHSGDAWLPPLKAGQLAIPDEIPVIKALQGSGGRPRSASSYG
jgi:hypothetical protein